MKTVSLIGFRGTGYRNVKFAEEPGLIWVGHVGIAFEADKESIFGFHPTSEAIEKVGGEIAALKWLKAKNTLDGALQEDFHIFFRAQELSKQGSRTTVWELSFDMSDADYDRAYSQVIAWHNEKKLFTYAFPTDKVDADRDNCATFPRRLGLPLLTPLGYMRDFVQVLEQRGVVWDPQRS